MNIAVRIQPEEVPLYLEEQFDGMGFVPITGQAPKHCGPGDTLYLVVEGCIALAATVLAVTPRFRYRMRRFKWGYETHVWWLCLRYPDAFEKIPLAFRDFHEWYYVSISPSEKHRLRGERLVAEHHEGIRREEVALVRSLEPRSLTRKGHRGYPQREGREGKGQRRGTRGARHLLQVPRESHGLLSDRD